jgi:hypothetical protein
LIGVSGHEKVENKKQKQEEIKSQNNKQAFEYKQKALPSHLHIKL